MWSQFLNYDTPLFSLHNFHNTWSVKSALFSLFTVSKSPLAAAVNSSHPSACTQEVKAGALTCMELEHVMHMAFESSSLVTNIHPLCI